MREHCFFIIFLPNKIRAYSNKVSKVEYITPNFYLETVWTSLISWPLGTLILLHIRADGSLFIIDFTLSMFMLSQMSFQKNWTDLFAIHIPMYSIYREQKYVQKIFLFMVFLDSNKFQVDPLWKLANSQSILTRFSVLSSSVLSSDNIMFL